VGAFVRITAHPAGRSDERRTSIHVIPNVKVIAFIKVESLVNVEAK
jgi:hypothetical protein